MRKLMTATIISAIFFNLTVSKFCLASSGKVIQPKQKKIIAKADAVKQDVNSKYWLINALFKH